MSENAAFRKAVILIPAHDEVVSLRETVIGLESVCRPADVVRILLVLAPHATEACRDEAQRLAGESFPIPVVVLREIGGNAGSEAQQIFRGQRDASHAVIWTADQDASPGYAALMLEKAKENPAAVVKLSRFIPGGSLPKSKGWFVNLRDTAFSLLVRGLYFSKQTDPHFGLVLFPVREFCRFDLREKFMAFTIEYVLCFERLGTQFIEIPLKQQPRPEGKSNLKIIHKLRYFVPVIRLRFLPKRKILKEGTDEGA